MASHRTDTEVTTNQGEQPEISEHEKHPIDMLDKKNIYLDPFLILKRGYSVTYYLGKALKDPAGVPKNADLTTRARRGNTEKQNNLKIIPWQKKT